jgi:hypothetical protein
LRLAVALAKAKHALGRRYKSIAKARGAKADTLMRWCRRRGTMCDVGAFEVQRVARTDFAPWRQTQNLRPAPPETQNLRVMVL